MFKRFLPLIAAGVALWQLKQMRQRKAEKARSTPEAKPPAETLWEGEGGALPESGPQLGPEPRVAA